MPIRRKICRFGGSFAVFLPRSWIGLLEEKYGKIEAVSMEVNGKITIRPILKSNETSKEGVSLK